MIHHNYLKLFVLSSCAIALAGCGGGDDSESTSDTTAPVITLSGNETITVEATSDYTDDGASATDNVDGSVLVTTSGEVDTSALGSYTLTYSATDNSGNTNSVTREINVVDTTAPIITLTGNSSIELLVGETFSEPGVTATDSFEGSVTVSTTGSVDTTSPGTYTLTYTAADSSGNSASESRTVNVVSILSDTTAPVISLAGDATMTIEAGTTFNDPGVTATDDVDGSVSVTTSGNVNTSVPGTYTITYSATDTAGNTSSATREITVVDTTAPEVSLAGNAPMTVEAGSTFNDPGATATDNIDGSVSVTASGNVDTSALGSYTITYSATDSAGNTGSETREVNVVDTIAPVITLSGDSTIELLASENFTDPGATATDSFEGSLSVSTSGSVDNTAEGTYTLTYTASDSSGNSASETRTVNVLPSTVLTVQTQNYFTGDAIEGAPVSITATEDGDEITRTGITDSNGEISVAVADDAERIVVSSDAEGYGEYSAIVTTLDQTVDLFLQPVNAEISFTPTTESDLEVSGINVVSLAANSLVDENGNTPTGDVSAELTIIDPSVDPELMPGNFETLDTDTGEAGQIESFGAVSVTFEDEDGNSYNLNSGETATVRIPLASGTSSSSAPDTIPLYYFDEETGYWVEEGTATLVTNDGETYYEGTVSHFTTWNADYLYDSIQINGCVEDSNGDPISLAEIKTQGVSYSGQAWTTSDATGSFSVAAKPSSTVLLSATTPGGLSRTSTITTSSVDIDQSECIILDESAAVVTLTWGASPSDLDTHFFGPDSEDGEDAFHISYTNKEETINNSSIWLDVDDTSSYGPEITTISSFPYSGRYSYAVYKYSSSGSDIAESPARVELNYSGQRQVFSAPEGDATRCWAVFDFVVDEQGGVTIEETGSWESYSYCHAGEYSADDYSTQSNHQSVTEDNSGVLKDMILRKYYAK